MSVQVGGHTNSLDMEEREKKLMRFGVAAFVVVFSIRSSVACECIEGSKRQAFKHAAIVFRAVRSLRSTT